MEQKVLAEHIQFSDDKFTKRVIFNDGTSTVFVLNFKPAQSLPKHKHPGTNVFIHVLTGSGVFEIDGQEVACKSGDVFLIEGKEEMAFQNNGKENVSLYVMLNKIPNENFAKDI